MSQPQKLQLLMDQAWRLAVARAKDEYDICPIDDEYLNSDQQVINDLQTEIFLELGGNLDEYCEKCC